MDRLSRRPALAQNSNAYLRVAVCTLSPLLLPIPWEYFLDGDGFLLQDPKVHVVRVLDELPEQMAPFQPFTRLLLAIANPADMPRFEADDHLVKMQKLLNDMSVGAVVVFSATREQLLRAIEDEAFDAFYFLGHGAHHAAEGGQIFLEDAEGKPDPLSATVLASRLAKAKNRVCFAYFNSCDTADADGQNTFSGVAQRVLANGRIPAVLAQQAPVRAVDSMRMAETFLRRMKAGESPEAAVAFARSAAPGTTWGIPVLYTHLRGAEEFERNRIACLLSADIGVSRFGFVLPSFGMGVRLDGQGEMTAPKRGTYQLPAPVPITVTVDPPDTFVYPGETYARDDMDSARDIDSLLSRVAKPENVSIYPSPQQTDVTHWFLFGSFSSRYVEKVLNNYSPRFQFRRLKDKWCLYELDVAGNVIELTNTMPAPYHLGQRDFANQEDLGIIEKITDRDGGRVFFILAGLGSRATRVRMVPRSEVGTAVVNPRVEGLRRYPAISRGDALRVCGTHPAPGERLGNPPAGRSKTAGPSAGCPRR